MTIRIRILKAFLVPTKWNAKRWKAYIIKRDFDRFYNTYHHMKTMSKEDRSIILFGLPYEELEEAITWLQLESIVTGN